MVNILFKERISRRDSNMELCRLVAMLLVVLVHFNGFGLGYIGMKNHDFTFMEITTLSIRESFFIIGVPLFLLISGYYGIKLKIKSVVNLYCICLFYSIFLLTIGCIYNQSYPTVKDVLKLFFPFSSGSQGWWFIPVYFCLMLCSPIINKSLENISERNLIIYDVLLLIINCYFGYFRGFGNISGGTTFVNFVFIYFIGHTIHIFENRFKYKGWMAMLLFFVLSIINGCIIILLYSKTRINHSIMIEYNNPILILSAVFLFLFFLKLSFKSVFINWMAASSLAIYLLHIHEPIFSLIFPFNTNAINNVGLGGVLMYARLLILLFLIVFSSIFIDQIRIYIMRPIQSLVERIVNKCVSLILRYLPKIISIL